jgi:hypothetical protein
MNRQIAEMLKEVKELATALIAINNVPNAYQNSHATDAIKIAREAYYEACEELSDLTKAVQAAEAKARKDRSVQTTAEDMIGIPKSFPKQ